MADTPEKVVPRKEGVALATIGVVDEEPIEVHFNPVSLQFTISNQLKESGGTQYVATATMKLAMDLIFDSTDTGRDVTETTRKIQAFLGPETPPGEGATNQPPPPKVRFEWGTIRFEGFAEGYKETLDFFSIDGVPLRASVNLALTRADRVFEKVTAPGAVVDAPGLFDVPAQSAADASKNAQAPGAARALAAANSQRSLRFGDGGPLTVGASVELKPAVAFSSGSGGLSLGGLSLGGGAGAGLSLGGGAGAGLSLGGGAGSSLGGSAGLSLGGGASFGASAGTGIAAGGGVGFSVGGSAGVSASAGISGLARLSATEGAFSGLRISARAASSARFDPAKLAPKISSATAALDAGATFQVGGKAIMQGSGGLRADVGASGKLSFDAG